MHMLIETANSSIIKSINLETTKLSTVKQIALTISLSHKNDWIFDTAASFHISPNINKFKTICKNNGTVEVNGRTLPEYKGKETCLLYPLLPDNISTIIQLYNIFFIPILGFNLIS